MAKRKSGKKKKWCELYRSTNRRMINKLRKLNKYVLKNQNDKQAADRLKELRG